jgi:WD40 repeat protein
VWDARSGRQVLHVSHRGVVWDIAFSPDAACVVTAQTDNTARLWAIVDGGEAARLEHEGRVSALAFSPRWSVSGHRQLGSIGAALVVAAGGPHFRCLRAARV